MPISRERSVPIILVKLVPQASRIVVDRSQWAWSFVMYPECGSVRTNGVFFLASKVLTHYGILVSGTCIIGKTGIVADRSPANNSMRTLHFVCRQGVRIVGESRVRRSPWLGSSQGVFSHCFEVCMAMPETWMLEITRSFLRTFGCRYDGNDSCEIAISIVSQEVFERGNLPFNDGTSLTKALTAVIATRRKLRYRIAHLITVQTSPGGI